MNDGKCFKHHPAQRKDSTEARCCDDGGGGDGLSFSSLTRSTMAPTPGLPREIAGIVTSHHAGVPTPVGTPAALHLVQPLRAPSHTTPPISASPGNGRC